MKIKIFVLLALVIALSSCGKKYTSLNHSTVSEKQIVINQNPVSEQPSANTTKEAVGITSEKNKNDLFTTKPVSKKQDEFKKQDLQSLSRSEIKKELKELKRRDRQKKEMNPQLSRALWMTIPGGLAVILGILLYGVAPTGLFIFAFSLVFLVGLVSLILYWANPKPKM